MSVKKDLLKRSGSKCELCGNENDLSVKEVSPSDASARESILLCQICKNLIENPDENNSEHWHCLNDSMWSTQPAVQVMAYRILKSIKAQDLLDILYLENDIKAWADAEDINKDEDNEPTLDANNTKLQAGDSVTIIKDLEVKGAGFTAKRGCVVKNISLTNNPKQIEGRVNGTRIVLVSKFLKKI